MKKNAKPECWIKLCVGRPRGYPLGGSVSKQKMGFIIISSDFGSVFHCRRDLRDANRGGPLLRTGHSMNVRHHRAGSLS